MVVRLHQLTESKYPDYCLARVNIQATYIFNDLLICIGKLCDKEFKLNGKNIQLLYNAITSSAINLQDIVDNYANAAWINIGDSSDSISEMLMLEMMEWANKLYACGAVATGINGMRPPFEEEGTE